MVTPPVEFMWEFTAAPIAPISELSDCWALPSAKTMLPWLGLRPAMALVEVVILSLPCHFVVPPRPAMVVNKPDTGSTVALELAP